MCDTWSDCETYQTNDFWRDNDQWHLGEGWIADSIKDQEELWTWRAHSSVGGESWKGNVKCKTTKSLELQSQTNTYYRFCVFFIPLFLISPLGKDIPDTCQFWDTTTSKSAPKKFATKMPKLAKIGPNFAFFVQKRAPAWKKYTTASGCDSDKYQLWANANEILNTSSFKHCSSYFISFYRKYNLFKGKLFTFKVYLFHSKIISSLSCSFNVPFSFSWHKLVRTKCRNSSAPHILCQLLTTVPPLLSPFSSSC